MHYEYCLRGGMLCLRSQFRQEPHTFFCPLPPPGMAVDAQQIAALLSDLLCEAQGCLMLCPLTEAQLQFLTERLPRLPDARPRRDLDDYIYDGEALRTLSGKKYDGKRGHLKHFESAYPDAVLTVVTPETLPHLREAAETLYHAVHPSPDLEEEHAAILRACQPEVFSALSLRGALLERPGEIIAYTIGQPIEENGALIHFEKASRDYPGAYAAIHHHFLCRAFPHAEEIDREEDMGMEGLRRAKLSYHPSSLKKVYEIRIDSPAQLAPNHAAPSGPESIIDFPSSPSPQPLPAEDTAQASRAEIAAYPPRA